MDRYDGLVTQLDNIKKELDRLKIERLEDIRAHL